MKTEDKKNREYTTPVVESIELDNEISLILASAPPGGPGEVIGAAPEYFNPDPFKSILS